MKHIHSIGRDPVDLVIFDCDGVLVDSETISASVLIDMLDEIGIPMQPDFVRAEFLGRSFPTVAKTIRASFQIELPDDFERAYRATLLRRFVGELRPTSGIEALLPRLRCAAAVATSSSPERVTRTLEIAGLAHWFGPHVFTASLVANGKPAPDLFLHVARAMAVAPARCLVIEDSGPGIAAAQAAGMRVLFYRGGSHHKGTKAGAGPVPALDGWDGFPAELLDEPVRGTA